MDAQTAYLDRDVFNKRLKSAWGRYLEKASPTKSFASFSFHLVQCIGLLSQSHSFLNVYTQMGNSRLQVF